jgi:hypothetical protein
MSGNKGAVGIRLQYHDTTFCFITAHLAAGHSNVEERDADYRTITSQLHFLKGKTITSHEWAHHHHRSWNLIHVLTPQKRYLACGHELSY